MERGKETWVAWPGALYAARIAVCVSLRCVVVGTLYSQKKQKKMERLLQQAVVLLSAHVAQCVTQGLRRDLDLKA